MGRVNDADDAFEARLRRIYERLAAGDLAPLTQFLAEDVVYHLPGRHLGGGTLHGRAEVLERLIAGARDCDAPPLVTVVTVLASGDQAVSLERFVARRRRHSLDQDVWVFWRFAGGRCIEGTGYLADSVEKPAFDPKQASAGGDQSFGWSSGP